MNAKHVSVLIAALVGVAQCKILRFENRQRFPIWVGSQGHNGNPPINDGGWLLEDNVLMTMDVDDSWEGSIWGRTGCHFDNDGNGLCETGGCGGRLHCRGLPNPGPVSVVDLAFNVNGGQDHYNLNLTNGFNLPIYIIPLDNFGTGVPDHFYCTMAICPYDINPICLDELREYVGDKVIGCRSACQTFNTDEYCCRGSFNTPESCNPTGWPVNYSAFFKEHCVDAYTHKYEDTERTFTCEKTGYIIQFRNNWE